MNGNPENPKSRLRRNMAVAVALSVALIVVVSALVLIGGRLLFDAANPLDEMRDAVEELELPDDFELVKEVSQTVGLFGERPRVERFYATELAPHRACKEVEAAVAVSDLAAQVSLQGPAATASCLFSGSLEDIGLMHIRVHEHAGDQVTTNDGAYVEIDHSARAYVRVAVQS